MSQFHSLEDYEMHYLQSYLLRFCKRKCFLNVYGIFRIMVFLDICSERCSFNNCKCNVYHKYNHLIIRSYYNCFWVIKTFMIHNICLLLLFRYFIIFCSLCFDGYLHSLSKDRQDHCLFKTHSSKFVEYIITCVIQCHNFLENSLKIFSPCYKST